MSKHSLPQLGEVGKSFFSHADSPRNLGTLTVSDGTGQAVGKCGDSIAIDLKIDGDVIRDIRVDPQGCVFTRACASAVSELAKGKELSAALQIEPEDVEHVLGGIARGSYALCPSGGQYPWRGHCRCHQKAGQRCCIGAAKIGQNSNF